MKKKSLIVCFGIVIILGLLLYPYFPREITGPYIEIEGEVTERCADTAYLGNNHLISEVRSAIGIKGNDGDGLVALLPKNAPKEWETINIGDHVRAVIGIEKITGRYVFVKLEKTDLGNNGE